MIHVKAEHADPTSATISIRGLSEGRDNADLRKGFITALEAPLAKAKDEDGGPTLRVGSALAGLGLRKVEDVDPVDIADAAFPDDLQLNAALVKLLRLAELRMQYAAAGRKVSGRLDMQKLWDLDRNIARARREAWTRIGKGGEGV
jgi:hypothetical protein|nr:MAG TPA: hypothetical protein [Caudoviricetes sp.]